MTDQPDLTDKIEHLQAALNALKTTTDKVSRTQSEVIRQLNVVRQVLVEHGLTKDEEIERRAAAAAAHAWLESNDPDKIFHVLRRVLEITAEELSRIAQLPTEIRRLDQELRRKRSERESR